MTLQKYNDETANIVMIVALPEEYDAVCSNFPVNCDLTNGQIVRVEHESPSDKFRLFSVLSENMGSENAMCATQSAITDLAPDVVICIGIAGGLTDDTEIGDVCVSNEIIDVLQNNKIFDKKTGPTGPKIGLNPKPYTVDNRLHASFRFLRSRPDRKSEFLNWVSESDKRKIIISTENKDLVEQSTKLHVGPIVCGPVSTSKSFNSQLIEMNRKVLCIETESGGVFRACVESKLKAITIRGISDLADANKNLITKKNQTDNRALAVENALGILKVQLADPEFIRIAIDQADIRNGKIPLESKSYTPETVLAACEKSIKLYLDQISPEYKNRSDDVLLPIPRAHKIAPDEDGEVSNEHLPELIIDALIAERTVYLKPPRSFPDGSLAWSVALSILKEELNLKQALPLVIQAADLTPPNNTLSRALGFEYDVDQLQDVFEPVFIINDPDFRSKTKMKFLVDTLSAFDNPYILIISKSETPVGAIDAFKADLGLVDYVTAAVPFKEIAIYLEKALELDPAEADVAATRLNDTFTKFRLNTHPAYFIGIQENTISALINANQRAELIQLAVDGLLTFVVASDTSEVVLGRTFREEFLAELAYEIKVNKRSFDKVSLVAMAEEFAQARALEVDSLSFVDGFFRFGLLNIAPGTVSFSLPFLEAYLLSQRLIGRSDDAAAYFNPESEDFDHFSFDLYCERGAAQSVIARVHSYLDTTLSQCTDDKDVFEAKEVKPRVIGAPKAIVGLAEEMAGVIDKISKRGTSEVVRAEKQRLIDARETVRTEVGGRKKERRQSLSEETRAEFDRLDRLSQSLSVVATMIGSGAERLDAKTKHSLAKKMLKVAERFLHYWTLDRMRINFADLREELLSEKSIEELIDQFDLFDDNRDEIRNSLSLFIDDQELKLLSGPLATILDRISSLAGVRSLKPIVDELGTDSQVEALIRGSWYMDVESGQGKKILKKALQNYKGSSLFRLVLTNHLMWRVFWHHWQKKSRIAFVDMAKYSLKPMGLITDERHEEKMLKGPNG